MKIAINSQHSGKHPDHLSAKALSAWWRWYNGAFKNVETSLQGLVNHIHWGHGYTTQHDGYRKAANFIQGQHIGLDFDDLPAGTTLQGIVDGDPFIAEYAALLHTTASHTPDAPRVRVLFALDRPIHNAEKYTLLARALLDKYSAGDEKPDPSCKDACRLFFGAAGCDTLSLGNVLTLEDAAELLVKPYKKKRAVVSASKPSPAVVGAGGVPASVLEAHKDRLLSKIANAAEGEKYEKLRDISRTFGGYVAGGYYDHLTARRWLEDEIEKRKATVKSMDAAKQTIADGLAFGALEPLYFDVRTASKPEPVPGLPPMRKSRQWRAAALASIDQVTR